MAKRFTDNMKWKKRFFKSLPTVYKLFFLYILDDCDHAGVWDVEMDVAETRIGEPLNYDEALKHFNKHVHEIEKNEKWFIPSFVVFQYGELNPEVKPHRSVLNILEDRNLLRVYKGYTKGTRTTKDKDKDKNKDKDKDKDRKDATRFDEFYQEYPKKKSKAEALKSWQKNKLDGKADMIINDVKERRSKDYDWLKEGGQFIPHPSTYLNQKRWEDEITIDPQDQDTADNYLDERGMPKLTHTPQQVQQRKIKPRRAQ
jgi:hypothetical protein